jgi:uncharacterized protein
MDMKTCGSHKGCGASMIGYVLVIIGALNWGLVGIGGFLGMNLNLVNLIVGRWPMIEWIVYILVGIAAVMMLVGCKCKTCKMGSAEASKMM